MGDIREENIPFLGLDDFIEDMNEVDENIKKYNDNMETKQEIQSKLLRGLGWGQIARKNLSDDLEKMSNHNKEIEKVVTAKIREGYRTKFTTEQDEQTRKEKLTTIARMLMESLSQHKNINIQFKEKSKLKLINAIKITGAKFSEEEITDKIEKDDIESIISETEEAKEQFFEVKERHEEQKKLEEEILDLDELHKEIMGLMQGQEVAENIIEEKINSTKEDTNISQYHFQFNSIDEFYEKMMSKKKLLALIGAVIFLLILIIIISASTSGSDAEPEPAVEETTKAIEIVPCDPNEDPDCVG